MAEIYFPTETTDQLVNHNASESGFHGHHTLTMKTLQFSDQIFRPRRTAAFCRHSPPTLQTLKGRNLTLKTDNRLKWAVKLSLVEQSPPKSTVDLQKLVGFLYDDLPHLFDDQGIDKTAYDDRVFFRDPITKHDSLGGYLFNIALLKAIFRPQFHLHWAKQVCFSILCSELLNPWLQFMNFNLYTIFCPVFQKYL